MPWAACGQRWRDCWWLSARVARRSGCRSGSAASNQWQTRAALDVLIVDDGSPLQRRDALKVRVQLLLEEKVLVARVLPHLRQFFREARVRGALPAGCDCTARRRAA